MKKTLISKKIEWIIRIVVAVIILQTLRFKFLGAEESVLLFTQVSEFLVGDDSLEALLRIGTGIIELIAGVLLLITPSALYGAILTAATMFGAIKTHVFIIGISFNNDGGLLFAVGVLAFIGSIAIVFNRRDSLPIAGPLLKQLRAKYG